MNKKRIYANMMNNISKSLKSVLNEDSSKQYYTINEVAVVRQIEQARQFAIRVRNIANYIERDCKDYDESWALGYAEQLRTAADKLLGMLK